MKKLWNMVVDEIHRSRSYYLTVLVLVFLSQGLLAVLTAIFGDGPMSLVRLTSYNMVFFMTIGGAILAMVIYSFYTWFKEWKLQGRFIYRLMMLPLENFYIGLSKLVAILLMIGGLLALELAFFYLVEYLGRFVLGPERFVESYVSIFLYSRTNSGLFEMIFPLAFKNFFLYYLLGTGFLLAFFNIQIIGYSYWRETRLGTVILIGLYLVMEFFLALALVYVSNVQILVAKEIYMICLALALLNLILGLGLMKFVSNRKMSV